MSHQSNSLKVQDVGEQGLLKRLQSFCPANLVGDDAAVISAQPGRSLVVTSDVLVDGVHFSEKTTSPEDAGWRAAAANLSDLAAMGALPLGITVGLGIPGEVTIDWVERLYQGLTACLQQYGTVIVGGDVVRSPITTIAITAFGEADPTQIIRRSTAQPGDAIVVTGPHGASRAGLELLRHPELGDFLSTSEKAALIQAHQRPRPRLDVLNSLWQLQAQSTPETQGQVGKSAPGFPISPLPTPYSLAGMDSSDGLADAILQICWASRVGARIERSQLPMPVVFKEWLTEVQALEWTLYGGEDFELVLCLSSEKAQALVHQLEGAAIVGTVTADPDVWLVDSTGQYSSVRLSLEQGFQHF